MIVTAAAVAGTTAAGFRERQALPVFPRAAQWTARLVAASMVVASLAAVTGGGAGGGAASGCSAGAAAEVMRVRQAVRKLWWEEEAQRARASICWMVRGGAPCGREKVMAMAV